MIGLRQDMMQRQYKKKVQQSNHTSPIFQSQFIEPRGRAAAALANDANEIVDSDENASSTDKEDDDNSGVNITNRNGMKDANEPNKSNITNSCGGKNEIHKHNGTTNNVHTKYHQAYKTTTTKIQLSNNINNNTWKSLLRDIFIAFIPLFILFKISTHPFVANVGLNAPQSTNQQNSREQLFLSLFLKQQQEELQREYQFLKAMDYDEGKCYDYRTIDISAKVSEQQLKSGPKRKRKLKGAGSKPKIQFTTTRGSNMKVGNKMNRPLANNNNINKGVKQSDHGDTATITESVKGKKSNIIVKKRKKKYGVIGNRPKK